MSVGASGRESQLKNVFFGDGAVPASAETPRESFANNSDFDRRIVGVESTFGLTADEELFIEIEVNLSAIPSIIDDISSVESDDDLVHFHRVEVRGEASGSSSIINGEAQYATWFPEGDGKLWRSGQELHFHTFHSSAGNRSFFCIVWYEEV